MVGEAEAEAGAMAGRDRMCKVLVQQTHWLERSCCAQGIGSLDALVTLDERETSDQRTAARWNPAKNKAVKWV